MKCADIKIILLEASAEDIKRKYKNIIEEHTSGCEDCMKHYIAAKNYELLTTKLSEVSVDLNFDLISKDLFETKLLRPEPDRGTLIYYMQSPIIKFAASIVLLITFLFYSSLEMNDMNKLKQLEAKIRKEEIPVNTISTNKAGSLSNVENTISSLLKNSGLFYSESRQNNISPDDIKYLLSLFIKNELVSNKQLRDFFENNNIDIEDGLNEGEIQKLINADKNIKSLLKFDIGKEDK